LQQSEEKAHPRQGIITIFATIRLKTQTDGLTRDITKNKFTQERIEEDIAEQA